MEQQKIEEMIALYRQGVSQPEIGRKISVSQASISKYLSKFYPFRRKARVFRPLELSSEEAAYIAGFIDGEGSFSLRREANGNHTPFLRVTNTNHEVIDWLKNKFHWGYKGYTDNRREKPCWTLEMRGMTKLIPLILVIEPFLIVKKKHAKLIKEFCESRLNALGKEKPHSTRELGIIEEIHSLNKRGRW